MRRIIERVVTVVTTTTWTITWQDDALHPDPQTDSEQEVLSTIETKEAEPLESKTETISKTDEPS